MNKLMSIFGAIVFASFIMTSCGGASADASPEAAATPTTPTPEVSAEKNASTEAATTSTTPEVAPEVTAMPAEKAPKAPKAPKASAEATSKK